MLWCGIRNVFGFHKVIRLRRIGKSPKCRDCASGLGGCSTRTFRMRRQQSSTRDPTVIAEENWIRGARGGGFRALFFVRPGSGESEKHFCYVQLIQGSVASFLPARHSRAAI